MAATSRASCKSVEDVEIYHVLEENTDSNVTIFSSEEDEHGNEPDSDEMNNWITIQKQMKLEALLLEAKNLLI